MASPLHIALVVYSLEGGGAERVAADLASCWAASGHKVQLVTVRLSTPAYNLDEKVLVHSLGLSGESHGPLHTLWSSAHRALSLRSWLLRAEVDVVIGIGATAASLAGAASLGTTISSVGCEHTYPPRAVTGRTRELLRSAGYGLLNVVVGLTDEAVEWLQMHTLARRVVKIPNSIGLPLPDLEPRLPPELIVPPNRKVLLTAGRLHQVKNHEALIRAFAALASELLEWDLVVVGDGPERPRLEAFVKSLSLSQRAFLPGRAGNVAEWFKRADLFALTSRNEGLPMALIEALAHGCPAISYDW